MLLFIVCAYGFYIGLKIFISLKEIKFVKNALGGEAVLLDSAKFEESGEYKLKNERFAILSSLLDVVMFGFWVFGGLAWLESVVGGAFGGVAFVVVFVAINYVVGLPFDVYGTFVKDKQFSNTTPKLFIIDQIKSALLFLVFGSLVIWFLIWVIGAFELWWLWGFAGIFALVITINMIYPTFIAPLFNKFSPLEDGELKESIVALMQKAGLVSSGIFTVDASKRDKRLNAYFGGLGKSKRVVLYDTLVSKLNKSELLAVLGHELGHFAHKDIFKNIALMGVMLFVVFAIFGNLPTSVFDSLHVEPSPFMSVTLIILLSSVVMFFIMPIFGYFSRANEYEADKYGSECESKTALKNALLKLIEENRAFPLSSELSIIFYHTHPPLVERLKRLEE